ncbi:MAG: hypothetical protein K6E40_11680 [Desulfovibrio sp.]|nr:hypothetical protein [Desulfovibrio sp.]
MSRNDEDSGKQQKKKSPNLGGRRPGAGRPKGSKYGKRQHYMLYLNSRDSEKFEDFAGWVGLSPYMVLKAFAVQAIGESYEELSNFMCCGDKGHKMTFSVSVTFTAEHPGWDIDEAIPEQISDEENEETYEGQWPPKEYCHLRPRLRTDIPSNDAQKEEKDKS